MSGTYKYLRSIILISSSALIMLMIAIACSNRTGNKITETPTSGSIHILADSSFQPIVDAEISTFTGLYRYAHITPTYVTENDLISAFLDDSVKVVVTAWEPSAKQKELLLNTQIVVRTTAVAYDAIALVLNKENKDSLLTYDNVNDLFTGKLNDWKSINPASDCGKMSTVFDNEKSTNIRYFKEEFKLEGQLPSSFYAVKSNEEVIDYVSKNKGAIGLVSVNWICDKEDSTMRAFSNKIKIAAISQKFLEKGSYFLPVQGSIYDKSYPFTRKINLVSRESFSGLGSGFVSWFSSEQGQRIVLKSGLVPATMPIRLIQFKK
ncbi:phosphate ABC transporter, phosphate-binding component [Aquipluma nitroreducens]|uniref:Phosphate ABC transporter, phosphate-binding component n=1 Tax=Aquipluma nitroreducens TaxID=2010828 RepID=A0A5K7SCU6_9BACT|nr:substrate-binding domain-containing protein [Aquipluma nitroreducens]BBE19390.1 phosphate ABC transporter, phosphate-binding component [Aquipluma nitroreducens]